LNYANRTNEIERLLRYSFLQCYSVTNKKELSIKLKKKEKKKNERGKEKKNK